MFFELTNSPAIFQIMVNERDSMRFNQYSRGGSFIDNVIVRTKEEKGYDEVVEEVVKMFVENDLYMKPKKIEVEGQSSGILGVVIGPEEIKIEKEKMKEVLDLLTLKGIKDVQKFLGLENYY